MVAHRGVSGLETENTCAAFIAAGNRSYYGIETDVHVTSDGKYVTFHDDETRRLAAEDMIIEQTDFATLRSLILRQKDGKFGRTDIRIPTMQEYIEICKHYEKVAVLELKNHFQKEQVFEICDIIDEIGYLENVIFISFDFENLVYVKEKYPQQPVQFLTGRCDEELARKLSALNMDLDIYFEGFDGETAERCHRYGIKVNCWTVDRLEAAARLADLGASFITSNILE
jgi:glycerophosphoryl diester phosphodiesterase